MERIHQQQSSELLSLILVADSEPAQQRRWNQRIFRKFLGEFGWKLRQANSVRGKRVISQNSPRRINHHEWRRHFPSGVLAGLPAQVIVQLWNATAERGPIVVAQRLERVWPKRATHSSAVRDSCTVARPRAGCVPVQPDSRLCPQKSRTPARSGSAWPVPEWFAPRLLAHSAERNPSSCGLRDPPPFESKLVVLH